MRFLRMFWECFTVWRVRPVNQNVLSSAQVIAAYSASRMEDGSVGEPNCRIADVARSLQRAFGLPIITQEEIAMAAPELSYRTVLKGGDRFGNSSFAWNTAVLADRMVEMCRKSGWRCAIVVASPMHQPRCCWVLARRGLHPLAAAMPGTQRDYVDSRLAQRSVRSVPRFVVREFLSRLLFLFRGDI